MTFRSWILKRAEARGAETLLLQWGHDLSVMDTPPSKSPSADWGLLQWGHDLSVMDTPTVPLAETLRSRFNGAMTFRSWIHSLARIKKSPE